MQIFKKNLLFIFIFSPFVLFAQTMPQMPQMPQMPTMTMPSANGFYVPEVPVMPSMPVPPGGVNNTNVQGTPNQQGNQNNQNNQNNANQQGKQNNQNNQNNVNQQGNLNNKNNANLGNQQYQESLKSNQKVLNALLTGGQDFLSASDISGMYDLGLFGSIAGLGESNNSVSTDVLLAEILNSLDEIKSTQVTNSGLQNATLENNIIDNKSFKKREPQILRFKINGFNIIDSFETVFFSDLEADGTFLLSADRVYYINQEKRTETVYLLFKTVKSNGSTTTYEVVPTLSQDYENQTSSMYKMAEIPYYKAEKTGNMVTLHYSEQNFNMDVLLNLDN